MVEQLSISHNPRFGGNLAQRGIRKIVIALTRPSSYLDDYGMVRIFNDAYIPSNSLAVMYTLFKQFFAAHPLQGVEVEIVAFDDAIAEDHFAMHDFIRHNGPKDDHLIILGLTGVQTHEMPRARDIARQWQGARLNVFPVIGGFGVSGLLRTLYWGVQDPQRPDFPEGNQRKLPSEIQEFIDEWIIVFDGEAEGPQFSQIMKDVLNGTPKPLYYEEEAPDITFAPIPEFPPGHLRHLIGTTRSTIDPSRGCPFRCSYCSIINFRGTTVRSRDPHYVVEHLKTQCRIHGSCHAFFTDDNFVRNRRWRELLEIMALARREGYRITATTELDTKAIRFHGIVELLRQAGFTTIFSGVESLNEANYEEAQLQKSAVRDATLFAEALRDADIISHAGYIIGFSDDSLESVKRDVARLGELYDIASFFYLTILPGSEDHARAVRDDIPLDPDLNWYSSFRPISDHATMSREEWVEAYESAWEIFYRPEKMIRSINEKRALSQKLALLGNYLLWRKAHFIHGIHPMICGFGQRWDYRDRRPGAKPLPYPQWLPLWCVASIDRTKRKLRMLRPLVREFLIFRRVILETGIVSLVLRERRREINDELRSAWDWARRTFGVHSGRTWLNAFWARYAQQRHRLAWDMTWHLRAIPHAATEVIYWFRETLDPRSMHHPWVSAFWTAYRKQGWRLLTNPWNLGRHLLVLPLFLTEFFDFLKYITYAFPRVLQEVKRV